MKELIKKYANGEFREGFTETVLWRSFSDGYFPKEPGEYITADGDGKVRTMFHTSANFKKCSELVIDILSDRYEEYRSSEGRELTFEDLQKIQSCGAWYEEYEVRDSYGDCRGEGIVIMTGDDIPKFWLDTKLSGPITKEIDTYEKEYFEWID